VLSINDLAVLVLMSMRAKIKNSVRKRRETHTTIRGTFGSRRPGRDFTIL